MAKEDNKKLIEEKNIHLWFSGSPVALYSMKLELDISKGAMFAYAKMMNVQPEPLKTVVCDLICYDSIRNVVDTIKDVTYELVDLSRNSYFGMERPIRIRNNATRNVEFILRSVTISSGDTWENSEGSRFDIDLQQESLINVQADLNKDFIDNCTKANIDHTKLILQPVFDDIHWMCACGTLNWTDEDICSFCGVRRDWLEFNVSKDHLKKQADIRISESKKIKEESEARERLDKERQQNEFEQRKASYQKQQKQLESKKRARKLIPVAVIAVLLAVGGAAFVFFGLPYIEYQKAVDALNYGNYDTAIEKFSSMKNYMDSETLLKKAKYSKAMNELYSGDPEKAMSMFEELRGFEDSGTKYLEAANAAAAARLAEKNYMAASEMYRIVVDGENEELAQEAKSQLKKCNKQIYRAAQDSMMSYKYEDAKAKFEFLGEYSDSAEQAKLCTYKMANIEYKKRHYPDAIRIYETIPGYKDVDEILASLENFKKITSAAEEESPAVWNGYKIKNPKTGNEVDYVLEFYLDGKYKFTTIGKDGSDKKDNQTITGSYKIEDDIIYNMTYENGREAWEKMSKIKSIKPSDDGIEGKNTVMKLTDPITKKDNTITVYGNIISGDNITM